MIFINRKVLIAIIIVLALVGLSGAYVANQQSKTTVTDTTVLPTATLSASTSATPSASSSATLSPTVRSASYQGQDGKTALELLQQKFPDTKMSGTGANAFVTSINGYTADGAKKEYWSFLVNDKPATTGAGSYTTKSSETITWEIATY